MAKEVKRGEIYLADLDDMTRNTKHLMKGKRPVLIIQNDIGNSNAPTVIVSAISASISKSYPMHQKLEGKLDKDSVIMFEHIYTIDKDRLEGKIAEISGDLLQKANDKLAFSLGLSINDMANIVNIEVMTIRSIETKEGQSTEVKVRLQFKDRGEILNLDMRKIINRFEEVDERSGIMEIEQALDSIEGVKFIGEQIKE